MKYGSEFASPLQTAHLCFLEGVLGVKRFTANWAVYRECRQETLQCYWFHAAVSRQIYAVPDLCCIVSLRLVELVGGVFDPLLSSAIAVFEHVHE